MFTVADGKVNKNPSILIFPEFYQKFSGNLRILEFMGFFSISYKIAEFSSHNSKVMGNS